MPAQTKRFRPIPTANRDLQLVQSSLKEVVDSIQIGPLANCAFIPRVSLVAGANLVSHGLGRAYLSFFVARPTAAATLTEVVGVDSTKYISLTSSVAVIIDLLVL
jgi:hypothetical protein